MELEESALLHESDLMLAVLRVAAVGSGTLHDCLEHLRQLRRYARVEEPMPEDEVFDRLETVQAKLRLAGLIRVGPSGRCRITAFGRRVLADNPGGVDESVLMQSRRIRSERADAVPSDRLPSLD